jgi:hypothetical protein
VTLAIFLTAFLLMIITGAVIVVGSDRKWSGRRKRDAAAPRITSDTSILVVGSVTIEQARELAVDSIHGISGHEVEMVNDSNVVGWIGNSFTNIPSKAEYRLSVTIAPVGPNGPVQLLCGASPRFASSLAGRGRCQELAQLLASEVSRRLL